MNSGRSGRSQFRTVFIRCRCRCIPAADFRRTAFAVLLLVLLVLLLLRTASGGRRMPHRVHGVRRNEMAAARCRRRMPQRRSVWLRQFETGENGLRGIRLTASGIGLRGFVPHFDDAVLWGSSALPAEHTVQRECGCRGRHHLLVAG